MEIDTAGWFEDAAQFDETRRHHSEVGKHVVWAEVGVKRLHRLAHFAASFHDFLVRKRGCLIPLPRVLEGVNLRGGLLAAALFEEDVVVLVGLEWRVEVDEVYRFVLDVTTQDVEVIPVVEQIRLIPV